jgi:3-isopropylmalate/(R)-2-methylmalate dehydratase small subunit
MECPEAVDAIKDGQTVAVDTETGTITNVTTGEEFKAQPFPEFIAEIIEAGGLVPRWQKKLAAK